MSWMAKRVQNVTTSIFATMTRLSNAHGAINLGQGFPDFAAPDFVKAAAREAIAAEINQYAPSLGRVRLRNALAAFYQQKYALTFNPQDEILVTHGATEALYAAILGVVNPGDEVIVFEPTYDSYIPDILAAGGIPVFYTLKAPDFAIDPEKLAALFSDKTRLVIVNTPHNPLGKVYSRAELTLIADLCKQHDVLVLTDEVYENIVFDDAVHIPMAGLPGMRDRTITISSAGKTFSVTGWKVGWIAARPELVEAAHRIHQFTTFSGGAPFQEAIAVALETADDHGYYEWLHTMYQNRRDQLLQILTNAGLKPIVPAGTYFALVDISEMGFDDDVAFCRWLTTEIGVAAIPPSAFYHKPEDGSTLARFAFCKSAEVLAEAGLRLQKMAR